MLPFPRKLAVNLYNCGTRKELSVNNVEVWEREDVNFQSPRVQRDDLIFTESDCCRTHGTSPDTVLRGTRRLS